MKHVTIQDAKDRLRELASEVRAGDRIVLTSDGEPIAELVAPRRGGIDMEGLRRYKAEHGLPKRVFGRVPADFDDPFPEDFLSTPGPY